MPTIPTEVFKPIRVVHSPRPGTSEVTLVFGVGQRAEPAHLAGITHVAEHLLIRLAGPDSIFKDGETSASQVSFSATGSQEAGLDFLSRLVEAIKQIDTLTEEQVALEMDIHRTEDELRFNEAVPSTATIRYGLNGIGMVGAGTPAMSSLTRDEIVRWVDDWFTADNALIVLTGPWPDKVDQEFALASKPLPHRMRDAAAQRTAPVVVASSHGGVVLSVLIPHEVGSALLHAISFQFFDELRHQRGLFYEMGVELCRVDGDSCLLDISLGARGDRVRQTAIAVLEVAQRIADDGFSQLAIERVRLSATLNQLDAESHASAKKEGLIDELLLGYPPCDYDAQLARCSAITGEELRLAWAECLRSAIVLYDEDVSIEDISRFEQEMGFPVDKLEPDPLPINVFGTRARGKKVWRGHFLPGWSNDRAALDGQSLLLKSGRVAWNVDLSKVALAVEIESDVVLSFIDGRRVNIRAKEFWRGHSLVASILDVIRTAGPEKIRRTTVS